MVTHLFKRPRFWLLIVSLLVIASIIYYSWLHLSLDQKDVFEIIIFPLLIQPFLVIVFLEAWALIKGLRNEDFRKVRLTPPELIERYYGEQTLSWQGHKTAAVPIFLPAKKNITPEQITCRLEESFYQLPAFLQLQSAKIMKAHSQAKIFNNQTLSLRGCTYAPEKQKLTLTFIYSDYLAHALTNLAADIVVEDVFSVRDILEPGPKLLPLNVAKPSNHLGHSTLIKTADDQLLLPYRNDRLAFGKNTYAPSISGAVTTDIALNSAGQIDLKQVILQECAEELSERVILNKIILLGLTRELDRLGKPEIYFYAESADTAAQLQEKINQNPQSKEENQRFEFRDIDALPNLLLQNSLSPSLLTGLVLLLQNLAKH